MNYVIKYKIVEYGINGPCKIFDKNIVINFLYSYLRKVIDNKITRISRRDTSW